MPLPTILAGPILRRAEIDAVWIWLCTSVEINVSAEIYSVLTDDLLGEVVGQSEHEHCHRLRFGEHCYVHLIKVVPLGEPFQHTTVLAYRLFENESDSSQPLRDYVETQYGIGHYRFPTFVIQNPRSNALRALFVSCRKLHGNGRDASRGMLEFLEQNRLTSSGSPRLRPTALFLIGDQIYADDVCDIIFPNVVRLATDLRRETPSYISSSVNPSDIAVRQAVMNREAGFTSKEASNHLISLGEYAAMHMLSWNEVVWDDESEWPTAGYILYMTNLTSSLINYLQEYNELKENLLDAREGSRAMKKLLANVPTYMMFDDHDVTDDWNINPSWKRHVGRKRLGRRIISNALVAYWFFQGWGNDPDMYDDTFIESMNQYANGEFSPDLMYSQLNDNHRKDFWSFKAPTKPVTVFLDFRTQRTATRDVHVQDVTVDLRIGLGEIAESLREASPLPFAPDGSIRNRVRQTRLDEDTLGPNHQLNGMSPRLINSFLRQKARGLLKDRAGQPLILITGTPIVGTSVVDFGQEVAMWTQGSFTWDFESWRGDPESLLDLYDLLHRARPSVCAILSGDVHYGYSFSGQVSYPDGRNVNIGQFTSSSVKNVNFPDDIIEQFGDALIGSNFAGRWLYDGRGSRDGIGVSTGRVLFSDRTSLQRFGWIASSAPVMWALGPFHSVYCDESWTMTQVSPTSGGFITETNFGSLVASNNREQIISVQMYDANGRGKGPVVRLARPESRGSSGSRRVALQRSEPGNFRILSRPEMVNAGVYAALCNDSYRRLEASSPIAGWNVVREDITLDGVPIITMDSLIDPESGFNSRIYYNPESRTYVLCFRGTEPDSFRDWKADIEQGVRAYTQQYERAMNVAIQFWRIPDSEKIIVGHSLGGGLASAGASVTGLETYTFNSSGVNPHTLQSRGIEGSALRERQNRIRAYYLDGEILNALQDGEIILALGVILPPVLGHRIVIPSELTNHPRRRNNSPEIMLLREHYHHVPAIIEAMEQVRLDRYGY